MAVVVSLPDGTRSIHVLKAGLKIKPTNEAERLGEFVCQECSHLIPFDLALFGIIK